MKAEIAVTAKCLVIRVGSNFKEIGDDFSGTAHDGQEERTLMVLVQPVEWLLILGEVRLQQVLYNGVDLSKIQMSRDDVEKGVLVLILEGQSLWSELKTKKLGIFPSSNYLVTLECPSPGAFELLFWDNSPQGSFSWTISQLAGAHAAEGWGGWATKAIYSLANLHISFTSVHPEVLQDCDWEH